MRKPVRTLLGAVLVVLLTAEVAAADQAVTAEPSNVFAPADVTISQGERVTWTNNGGTHDVHFEDGFEQPADPSGSPWTVTRTFATAGLFPYYCTVHGGPGGSGMAGVVRVAALLPAPVPGVPAPGEPVEDSPEPKATAPRVALKGRVVQKGYRVRRLVVSADSKATVTCSCWKGKQTHEVTGSWRVKKAERLLRPKARLVVRVSGRRWTWTIRKGRAPLLVKRS
jgi:plastocyanin